MIDHSHPSRQSDELAELLVHIGRSARAEDSGAALTAAQWTALRFFARANLASSTPSAFASFQATTRGTASQTIKSLVNKGLLSRHRSESDGRSVQFELTGLGRDMLTQDPLRNLSAAIGDLPETDQSLLERLLPVLTVALARHRSTPAFGTCNDCKFYESRDGAGYCACVALDLAPSEIGKLCANFSLTLPATGDSAGAMTRD